MIDASRDEPDSSTQPPVAVRRISGTQTLPLRMQYLRPGLPASDSVFPADDDASTFHAGAFIDDELVSIATLYHEARPADAPGGAPVGPDHAAGTAWRLRGMATSDAARRRGAGAAALAAALAHARAHGGTLAWCNARTPAVAFYEAQGWTVVSDTFDIPTAGPHVVMERSLTEPDEDQAG